jgi:mRNA-degrading endonuclease RelE of RelBE toxin-antitoxin system
MIYNKLSKYIDKSLLNKVEGLFSEKEGLILLNDGGIPGRLIVITTKRLIYQISFDTAHTVVESFFWTKLIRAELKVGKKLSTLFLERRNGKLSFLTALPKGLARNVLKIIHTHIAGCGFQISKRTEDLCVVFNPPIIACIILQNLWMPDFLGFGGFSLPEPDWLIGMSHQFIKDIRNIDKKLQGRILEAISELLSEPTTKKGDTIKPLQDDKKGLWRYRIGDYRLIYKPNLSLKKILLMEFVARGAAYDD